MRVFIGEVGAIERWFNELYQRVFPYLRTESLGVSYTITLFILKLSYSPLRNFAVPFHDNDKLLFPYLIVALLEISLDHY